MAAVSMLTGCGVEVGWAAGVPVRARAALTVLAMLTGLPLASTWVHHRGGEWAGRCLCTAVGITLPCASLAITRLYSGSVRTKSPIATAVLPPVRLNASHEPRESAGLILTPGETTLRSLRGML